MHRAGEQLLAGAAGAEQHYRHVGAGDPLNGLADLHHHWRGGDDRAEHGCSGPALQPPVLLLDLVQMKGARDDQAEVVDVDRLLVEIVGAHADRLEGAFACAVAAGDDHLGVGLEAQDLRQHGETLVGAVGVGRKAEIESHHGRLVCAKRLDRLGAIARADHGIALVGPFELALQALVILDDQQDGKFALFGHARFRLGSLAVSAAGRVMVKVVPWPGRLSTLMRPPMAEISERASNVPMPKPPDLVETNGWNNRLRMKSPSMPTPLSVIAIETFAPLPPTRTVTASPLLASSAF